MRLSRARVRTCHRYVDVAYDGFFFAKDLNVTRKSASYTKPNFWFVDSELFCPWSVWLTSVGPPEPSPAQPHDRVAGLCRLPLLTPVADAW